MNLGRFLSLVLSLLLFLSAITIIGACGWDGEGDRSDKSTNTSPVADAGMDQEVEAGSTVVLDGSNCLDGDGDPLVYTWSFSSIPTGSSASLSDDSISNPVFNADVEGEYLVSLVVNDGKVDSDIDTVTITAYKIMPSPEPDIRVVPLNHDFGFIMEGESSSPLLVTLFNDDAGDLIISDIYIGTGSDFSFNLHGGSSPCASASPVLAQGESCTLEVTFSPASIGILNDTLTISSNDPYEPELSIPVTGVGVEEPGPDISAEPLTYDFGEVEVTRSSKDLTVYIRNNGNAELNISEVSLDKGADFKFNLLGGGNSCVNVPRPLYQKSICTMTVAFEPASTGILSDTLYIKSDDPDEPVISISLTGTGLPEHVPPKLRETDKLKASYPLLEELFGHSVYIDGSTALVGAEFSDTNGIESGAAFVFEPVGSSMWRETSMLVPSDASEYYRFGSSVSLDGKIAAVGSSSRGTYGEPGAIWCGAGAVYVFEFDPIAGDWNEEAILVTSDSISNRREAQSDAFGVSVSVSGSTIVGGASGEDSLGNASGAAYVFERDAVSGDWNQTQKLRATDGTGGDNFGTSVSVDGDIMVVGAQGESRGDPESCNKTCDEYEYCDPSLYDLCYYPGAAYVFERDAVSGNWKQVAKLTASDAKNYDYFGSSVSLSGTTIVVGAWGDDDKRRDDKMYYAAGAAYVFERDPISGAWKQVAKLTASDYREWDLFGTSVSIDGDRIAVGASERHPDDTYPGSAYMFERDPVSGAWKETLKLVASDSLGGDWLGYSVSVSKSTVLVGSPKEDSRQQDSGAAYIFELE